MLMLTFLIVLFAIPSVVCMGAFYLVRLIVDCVKNREEVRPCDDFNIAEFYNSLL